MQVLFPAVAGIDVHKEKLAITVLIGPADLEPQVHQFESSTFTEDLMILGLKLQEFGVTHVAMESSGIYWKPLYHVLKPMGFQITLGNAAHMKNVPGRKTDMKDSHWIACLHRNGLIRPSYIPEAQYQELRLLTRHRQHLVDDSSRIKNRVIKILEDANIKLSSVLSDVFGVSGMAILENIAKGVTDKHPLAALAKTNLKHKEDLPRALHNTLTQTQCFLIKELLDQFKHLAQLIDQTQTQIAAKLLPHQDLMGKLIEVPGIDQTLAQAILAEATADMSHFKDDKRFAAWAGVAPGNNESGGKKKELKPDGEIPT